MKLTGTLHYGLNISPNLVYNTPHRSKIAVQPKRKIIMAIARSVVVRNARKAKELVARGKYQIVCSMVQTDIAIAEDNQILVRDAIDEWNANGVIYIYNNEGVSAHLKDGRVYMNIDTFHTASADSDGYEKDRASEAVFVGAAAAGVAAVGVGIFKGVKAAAIGIKRAAAFQALEDKIAHCYYSGGDNDSAISVAGAWSAEYEELMSGLEKLEVTKRYAAAFKSGKINGLTKKIDDIHRACATAFLPVAREHTAISDNTPMPHDVRERVEFLLGVLESVEVQANEAGVYPSDVPAWLESAIHLANDVAAEERENANKAATKAAVKAQAEANFNMGWVLRIACIVFIIGGLFCGPVGWIGSAVFGYALYKGIKITNANKARNASASASVTA